MPYSLIELRLARDRPTTAPLDTFSVSQIIDSIKSPHVLLMFIALFMDGTILYGLALFLPTIVNELGFSKARTQLISVGPYAAGFFGSYISHKLCKFSSKTLIVTLATAYVSDRYKNRAVLTAFIAILAVIGFSVFLGMLLCLKISNVLIEFIKLRRCQSHIRGIWLSIPLSSGCLRFTSDTLCMDGK